VKSLNFENVVFPDSVGFQCKNCGFCCREQPADTNAKEQQRIEAKGFKDFLEDPDGTGLRFIRRKKDGSCFFLTEDNKCMIYEVRPEICKIVPFIVTDWDYERNRIEVDLSPQCGCKGIFDGETLSIEEIGKAAQTFVQEMLEMTAKFSGLPITDKEVLSKTRILIMGMLRESRFMDREST
jgi:Fe-S-cluster containining protein